MNKKAQSAQLDQLYYPYVLMQAVYSVVLHPKAMLQAVVVVVVSVK